MPNVISPTRDRLGFDEYNGILSSFVHGVLVPVQSKCPIDFRLLDTDIDLHAKLPADVYDRLFRFSVMANKATGGIQLYEQERWMDFILAVHEGGATLDARTLERWLVETQGWPADSASRLASEYEFGRELLGRRGRVA